MSVFMLTALNKCADFGDINYNPNSPSQSDTRFLFLFAERYVRFFQMTGTYDPFTLIYAQYLAERTNIQYTNFNLTTFALTDYYRYPLKNLNEIIRLNEDESTKGASSVLGLCLDNDTQIAMARTLKAYIYMHLTDVVGMIPYSEAIKAKEGNYTPKYDDQQAIYHDLIKELEEAYGQFDEGALFGDGRNYDIFYESNVANWKRFNASIRMQASIKLFKNDEVTGKTAFAKAYNDGFIKENSQSFKYAYKDDGDNNHPLYENMIGRVDFYPSGTIMNMLQDYNDPRIGAYADKNMYGTYYGMPFGLTKEDAAQVNGDTVSWINSKYYQKDAIVMLITPSIMYFAAAEAAERGWITDAAEDLYKKGIEKAFEQHGFTTSDYTTYYAQPTIQYAGTKEQKIAKIATQKWIASYMQDSFEAWSDWRRLGVPDLRVGPSSTTIDHVPYRRIYDSGDYNANKANYDAAIAAQGADNRSTKVWWNK
jgi:hypothetical protein